MPQRRRWRNILGNGDKMVGPQGRALSMLHGHGGLPESPLSMPVAQAHCSTVFEFPAEGDLMGDDTSFNGGAALADRSGGRSSGLFLGRGGAVPVGAALGSRDRPALLGQRGRRRETGKVDRFPADASGRGAGGLLSCRSLAGWRVGRGQGDLGR